MKFEITISIDNEVTHKAITSIKGNHDSNDPLEAELAAFLNRKVEEVRVRFDEFVASQKENLS